MSLEHYSRIAAEAEAALFVTETKRQEAADKAARIRARLAEVEARKAELHAARINGNASASSAEQIVLLTGDAAALAEALQDAEKGIPDTSAEHAAYDVARRDLDAATNAARIEVLKEKASQADALLLKLLGEIEEAGGVQLGGMSLCQIWRPSPTLQRKITRDFPALFG